MCFDWARVGRVRVVAEVFRFSLLLLFCLFAHDTHLDSYASI